MSNVYNLPTCDRYVVHVGCRIVRQFRGADNVSRHHREVLSPSWGKSQNHRRNIRYVNAWKLFRWLNLIGCLRSGIISLALIMRLYMLISMSGRSPYSRSMSGSSSGSVDSWNTPHPHPSWYIFFSPKYID